MLITWDVAKLEETSRAQTVHVAMFDISELVKYFDNSVQLSVVTV